MDEWFPQTVPHNAKEGSCGWNFVWEPESICHTGYFYLEGGGRGGKHFGVGNNNLGSEVNEVVLLSICSFRVNRTDAGR